MSLLWTSVSVYFPVGTKHMEAAHGKNGRRPLGRDENMEASRSARWAESSGGLLEFRDSEHRQKLMLTSKKTQLFNLLGNMGYMSVKD